MIAVPSFKSQQKQFMKILALIAFLFLSSCAEDVIECKRCPDGVDIPAGKTQGGQVTEIVY